MTSLAELKSAVERKVGKLEWHDERWWGGSSWADGPEGQISVALEPPEGHPQIDGLDLSLEIVEVEPVDMFADLARWVEITPLGAAWTDEPMPLAAFGAMFRSIGGLVKALRWFIGDALNRCEELYGDAWLQFALDLGYEEATVQQYKRVCAKVPRELRRVDKWTIHQITCDLPPDVQEDLWTQVDSGEISGVTEMRDIKREMAAGEDVELLPPCPKCGGKLTSTRCKNCGLDFPQAVWWLVDLLKGE